MNRRSFIRQSSILSAVSLLPLSACVNEEKRRYKMGLQLFSVHEDMVADPIGTLATAKGMGYEDFEIYGFDPDAVSYYGSPASELNTIMDDMGLTVTSGHYGFSDFIGRPMDDLRRYVDQAIKGAKALKSPYITWPWLDPSLRNPEGFKQMADLLNPIGEQIASAGLGFAYHNHGFEFEDHDGVNGYDIVIANTDPELVKLQMDMYWVMHSSDFTPQDLIDQHPGRYVMWHVKDMDKVTRDYTELGNGSIDYTTLLPDPETSGLEFYYIEQGGNFTHSALKSAETSAKYFQEHLQHLL